MNKVGSLSSDIDFIKEFEELKLKQRLLIDNLKKKSQSEQERLFLEINAKLDFLVQIFKEANSTDETKETVDFEVKFNQIFDKIDSLSTKVEESFSKVEKLHSKLDLDKSLNKSNLNSPSIDKKELSTNSSDMKVPAPDKSSLPPPPNFKSNVEAKVESVQTDENLGKKKKWF